MNSADHLVSLAIFGDMLLGHRLVRFVFVDEAGTSNAAREKARVVASVIIDADNQLFRAERALDQALRAVPPQFQEGFVFHAEDIMNNDKYKDSWSLTARVKLLCDVMSIPRKLGAPISAGLAWKGIGGEPVVTGLQPFENEHWWAFYMCIAKADQAIRDMGALDEVGMVVAEENSSMRKALKIIPRLLREAPYVFHKDRIQPTRRDRELGYIDQDPAVRVDRIRSTVHFVSKGDDKLVWLADAVAYGMKRFFNGAKFGEQFMSAITPEKQHLDDYSTPISFILFRPPPRT